MIFLPFYLNFLEYLNNSDACREATNTRMFPPQHCNVGTPGLLLTAPAEASPRMWPSHLLHPGPCFSQFIYSGPSELLRGQHKAPDRCRVVPKSLPAPGWPHAAARKPHRGALANPHGDPVSRHCVKLDVTKIVKFQNSCSARKRKLSQRLDDFCSLF